MAIRIYLYARILLYLIQFYAISRNYYKVYRGLCDVHEKEANNGTQFLGASLYKEKLVLVRVVEFQATCLSLERHDPPSSRDNSLDDFFHGRTLLYLYTEDSLEITDL